jgi:hypothetical protein
LYQETVENVNQSKYVWFYFEQQYTFIPPGQRFGEFCQMKSFGHLCLQNYYFGTSLESIPIYDRFVKEVFGDSKSLVNNS